MRFNSQWALHSILFVQLIYTLTTIWWVNTNVMRLKRIHHYHPALFHCSLQKSPIWTINMKTRVLIATTQRLRQNPCIWSTSEIQKSWIITMQAKMKIMIICVASSRYRIIIPIFLPFFKHATDDGGCVEIGLNGWVNYYNFVSHKLSGAFSNIIFGYMYSLS